MRVFLALLLLLTLALAGCGSSSGLKSGPAPVSTQADSWKVYAPKGGYFKVSLPADWPTLDAQSMASGTSSLFSKASPELKTQLSAFEAMARRPGTLLGFDQSAAGKKVLHASHIAPNIIVQRAESGSTGSDAKIMSLVLAQGKKASQSLPGLTSSVVTHSTMAGLPAAALTYTFDEHLPSGTVKTTERDAFTVDNGTIYTISCATTATDYPRVSAVCDHVISTFALTG